jgi:hypothetical protein
MLENTEELLKENNTKSNAKLFMIDGFYIKIVRFGAIYTPPFPIVVLEFPCEK